MTTVSKPAPNKTQLFRERVWEQLRKVAWPDSRNHWDFSSFIPDFEGSDLCADRVRALPAYQQSSLLFITPDNSTEALRWRAIEDGKRFLMSTCGIVRGIVLLDPHLVPAEDRRYAATLDGIERFAQPVSLDDIRRGPQIGLLVTGGSAVNLQGVRFGKGHGYFDIEWALLSEIGAVSVESEVVDVVHDCQIVDEILEPEDHDVIVDWIITPTMTHRVPGVERPLGRVRWELLEGSPKLKSPVFAELRNLSLNGIRTLTD